MINLKLPRRRNLLWSAATATRYQNGWRMVLPVPPSGNSAYRVAGRRVISSKEWLEYQAAIGIFASTKRIKKIAAPQQIGLTIRWYRERAKGDLTNREKTIEDALQGICFDNDAQVQRKASIRYDDFSGSPRIEVEVVAITDSYPEGTAGA